MAPKLPAVAGSFPWCLLLNPTPSSSLFPFSLSLSLYKERRIVEIEIYQEADIEREL
jgi:hypothetical protein